MTAIHLFDHSTNRVTVPAGQAVFREGEPGNVMYALVDGEIDIVVEGRLIETVGPGAIIGEMALIEHGPRSATAQTRSDCTLVPVDEKEFTFLVQEHPTFALQVMRTIAARLRKMDHR